MSIMIVLRSAVSAAVNVFTRSICASGNQERLLIGQVSLRGLKYAIRSKSMGLEPSTLLKNPVIDTGCRT
ncbi:hypothetical protein U5903_21935 [Cereibacter johrii]|uniref:hypothetical protein n=1 Tax=Cereibacter johrii TaxID=445629 RepID=UPI002B258FA4|nr:hypothetical protein [Cereibacter johrii]MEA5163444.1 hypothetical protein [Cereibacter johrii]